MIYQAIAELRHDVKTAEDSADRADALGAIRAAKKALEAIEKEAKASFDDYPGGFEAEGFLFKALIVEKIDWRLDTKALKEEMGEEWYNARCRQILSRLIRTAEIDK
jgi:hypothetical protein